MKVIHLRVLMASLVSILWMPSTIAKVELSIKTLGDFVPVVKETETIFIDAKAKNDGDGSYKKPYRSFESALHEIQKQIKKNVVFLHGAPKDKYDFKEIQVLGPRAPLLIISKENGKERVRFVEPRASAKEKISLTHLKSEGSILGFNKEVDKDPIKTVIQTVSMPISYHIAINK